MVRIKYLKDALVGEPVITEAESVSNWLVSTFESEHDVIDLRFFRGDLLGEEYDTRDLSFLAVSEGTVTVIHDNSVPRTPDLWIYAGISLLFAAATYLLTPKPKMPNVGRDQQSPTNSLGKSNNEPRVNGRTDDIFGTVKGHTAALWQVPYRIGVNNEEHEVLFLGVGRGRYAYTDNDIFDGETLVKRIPDTQVNVYGPYTSPLSGDTPELEIGGIIDQPLGIYEQSNELNPTEMVPPNDLETTAVTWTLTGSGDTGTITATTFPEGWDANDYFTVGENIVLSEIVHLAPLGSITLYLGLTPAGTTNVDTFTLTDLGEELLYEVTGVTETSITVSLVGLPTDVYNLWQTFANYIPPEQYITLSNGDVVTDTAILTGDWFIDGWGTTPADPVLTKLNQAVGGFLNNNVGAFAIPEGVTKVLCNLVSPSGFYKLVKNNETSITATVRFTVDELDGNGSPTGNSTVTDVVYQTNPDKRAAQVFKTAEIPVPYTHAQISGRRITDRDKSENVSNLDQIEWRDLIFYAPVDVTEFGDVTTAHVVIPSNSTSRLTKDRRIKFNLTRKVTQYFVGGTFGPAESYPTDQFDDIIIHMALDPKIGRLSLEDVNADNIKLIRDQMISYFGSDEMCRFGYNFDSDELSFEESFIVIAEVVNCKPYVSNGVYDLFFEKKQTESVRQITVRNKIAGGENRKFNFEPDGLYDGVELTYRDENTQVMETIYIPENRTATNADKVELAGCVTRLQAWRKAWRIYQKQQLSFVKFNVEVDDFGRMITPGERIDLTDGTRITQRADADSSYRVYDGEVVEVNGLNIELSEPVVFTPGEDHYIQFTTRDGGLSTPVLCTSTDDEFIITLSGLPAEPVYDGYDEDRTMFTFMSEQVSSSIAAIPETIDVKIDDDSETHAISGINYTDDYYIKDLEVPQ